MKENLVFAPLIRASTDRQDKKGKSSPLQSRPNLNGEVRVMAPKAYSYIRFSTPEQLKGDSLRRQLELSEKYAAEHGLVLDGSLNLQDLGLSAFSGEQRDKGTLGRFLELVRAGRIPYGSVLLVESLDRLSREEITEALEQFLAIIRNGMKIVTLADNNREYTKETINTNWGDLVVSLTIMSRAHEESKMKSFRLMNAWVAKREKATNIGVKLTAKAPAWLRLNESRTGFEIIPERQAVVRQIFQMKLAGKGANLIAKELNRTPNIWKPSKKDKRKKNEGWRGSYIRKILTNPAVYGGPFQPHKLTIITGNDGHKKKARIPAAEPIENYYPPVVSKSVFFQVQALFERNRGTGGEADKARNLFQGLVKCGYCGGPMHFINKGPKRGGYLYCDRTRRAVESSCGCNAGVRYDEFQELVLRYCKGLSKEQVEEILGEGDGKKETEHLFIQTRLAENGAELKAIELQVENVLKQMEVASSVENRKLLDKRLSEKLAKKSSLEEERVKLESRESHLRRQADSVNIAFDSLKKLHHLLGDTKQSDGKAKDVRLHLRQKLKGLIEKIEVYPEGTVRYTPELVLRAIEFLSSFFPAGTQEHEWLRNYLRRRLEKPTGYRAFVVHFVTGSIRGIGPGFAPDELRVEWDQEKRELRSWGPEGHQTKTQDFEHMVHGWELIYLTGDWEALDKLKARFLERLDDNDIESALEYQHQRELEAKKIFEGLRQVKGI